jgi:hypothetical protein
MAANAKVVWVGRVISGLASLLFLFSAFMKFKGGPEVAQGMAHLGIPDSMLLPLGILEIACVVLYLIPPTAVLGAVLLAGYIGGVICTHWRVGDPLATPIVLGLCIWLGLYLREPRLKALLPLRRA